MVFEGHQADNLIKNSQNQSLLNSNGCTCMIFEQIIWCLKITRVENGSKLAKNYQNQPQIPIIKPKAALLFLILPEMLGKKSICLIFIFGGGVISTIYG